MKSLKTNIDTMTERITQINTYRDGRVTIGDYDDPAQQRSIEHQSRLHERDVINFQTTVDLNNLNNEYAGSIAMVEQWFADKGLRSAPIRVITRDVLHRAYRVGNKPLDETIADAGGQNINDRVLVVEDKENIDFFGEDFVLGIMLHESAHSTANDTELEVRRIKELTERQIKMGSVVINLGSLLRIDRRDEDLQSTTGDFFEEAFADLTRVKALRSLHKTHDLDGPSRPRQLTGNTQFRVVPNRQAGQTGSMIYLPAEFSMATKSVDGANWHATSASSFAAYALELLDNRSPGLYEDFNARRDPRIQARAISKIEAIRKGLYKRLRDLPYDDEGFGSGLKLVTDILNDTK